MWKPDQLREWARRLPPTFRSCNVGDACERDGRHWSESQGIIAALVRFGIVERVRDVGDVLHAPGKCRGHWRNSGFMFTHDNVKGDREAEEHEARMLMRIDGPREDRRADNLRIAADC